MTEIELKLQVPAVALAAVERAVATPAAVRTRLQAVYFDTPDRRLAAAGIALRLRKEGRHWVQTLKAGPAHGMARGEHNVPLVVPAGQVPQEADPARHAGTPPHAALSAALAPRDGETQAPALVAQYRTDIRRLHRPLRSRDGTVELALDRGEIVARGADGVERRWPVCELEVELLRGAPQAVVEVARRLALRHGLWLDVRTKAERGDRLARGLSPGEPVPAVKAEPLRLRKDMPARDAWDAVLRNVLAQATPNWSEIAAGSSAAEPVHQLRVALRRLRSAQRCFEGWPGVPPVPAWADAAAARPSSTEAMAWASSSRPAPWSAVASVVCAARAGAASRPPVSAIATPRRASLTASSCRPAPWSASASARWASPTRGDDAPKVRWREPSMRRRSSTARSKSPSARATLPRLLS